MFAPCLAKVHAFRASPRVPKMHSQKLVLETKYKNNSSISSLNCCSIFPHTQSSAQLEPFLRCSHALPIARLSSSRAIFSLYPPFFLHPICLFPQAATAQGLSQASSTSAPQSPGRHILRGLEVIKRREMAWVILVLGWVLGFRSRTGRRRHS